MFCSGQNLSYTLSTLIAGEVNMTASSDQLVEVRSGLAAAGSDVSQQIALLRHHALDAFPSLTHHAAHLRVLMPCLLLLLGSARRHPTVALPDTICVRLGHVAQSEFLYSRPYAVPVWRPLHLLIGWKRRIGRTSSIE